MKLKIKNRLKVGRERQKCSSLSTSSIKKKVIKKPIDSNNHLDLTELEIDSRKIEYYGYISEY